MTTIQDFQRLLGARLGDRLLTPGTDAFADLGRVVFAGERGTPGLIARPVDVDEVAAVVSAAARSGAPLTVRGAGHSSARFGASDGGVVLDTRLLDRIAIDPGGRIGTAAAGVTAGAYTTAAATHGLATGFGDTGSVGVAGLTLGGGIGHLGRRDGLTIDNLLSAEVVVADGSVVRASSDDHPDLFWALRGGGGNFGVVASLRYRLHETPSVSGGPLVFAPDPETVARLVAAAIAAPDELSVMVNVMTAPPAPFLPAELHGTPIVAAIVCHSGDETSAARDLAPLRAAGEPLADLVRRQPYAAMFAGQPEQVGLSGDTTSGFVDAFDETAAAAAIDVVRRAETAIAVVNLRIMGGAIARVGSDDTAFAHRTRPIIAVVGASDPRAERAADAGEWIGSVASVLGVAGGPGYVNFLGARDLGRGAAAAYPEPTLRRLADVKRAYDPANLFRSNHNVTPAADEPVVA